MNHFRSDIEGVRYDISHLLTKERFLEKPIEAHEWLLLFHEHF